jgi:hypothetical protein
VVEQHRRKEITMTQFVTESQAKSILAELGLPLRDQRPIDIKQFREQLEATVEPIWASHCAAGHHRAVGMALRKLGSYAERAKTVLRATERSAASPEMANYTNLLNLDELRTARLAIIELQLDLSRVPAAFSGKPKGPPPRAWYSGFVRDLAEIAEELGIDVTTGGDRSKNPHETPFTVFVFAVESLLPPGEDSDSLAACARQIDRAIAASEDEIDQPIARKGEQRKPAFSRLVAAASINRDPAHGQAIRNFLASTLAFRPYHCAEPIPPFSQDLKPSLVGLPPLPGAWGS